MAKGPKPTFTARAYKDGSGYLVEAEWPDGVIRLVTISGRNPKLWNGSLTNPTIGSASIQSRR